MPFSFSCLETAAAVSLALESSKYSSTVLSRSRSIASGRPVVSTAPSVVVALGVADSLEEADAEGELVASGAATAGMKLLPTTKAVAAAATMPRCAVFLFGFGINASPTFMVRVLAVFLPQNTLLSTGVVTKMKQ